jgi:hypothetical protein
MVSGGHYTTAEESWLAQDKLRRDLGHRAWSRSYLPARES